MFKKFFKAIFVISALQWSISFSLKSFYQIPLTWSNYYPGHRVLQQSMNVPKKSDYSDSKTLQEKEKKMSWGTLREPGTIRQRFYETGSTNLGPNSKF